MNIPAASVPTDYPPIGISRVMDGINASLDCDVSFFDLDNYRPSFENIKNRIESFSPDVIGFSAILTPTYAYLKKLSGFIKKSFPDIIQVMGGEMTAISNIVLLRTGVDFCVVGESEPIFSNLIRRLQQDNFQPMSNIENYVDIKGLSFLLNGVPYFTGYEKADTENSLRQFNYRLLSKFTSLDRYFHRADGQYFRMRLSDSSKLNYIVSLLYPHNRNKRLASVFASKGCVGKCTFCHRFFKGYKVADPDEVIGYIETLREDLNIGFIMFAEENFGSDKRSTSRLIEYLKNSGLNWGAGAVRTTTVNEQIIKSWGEAGCVHINFGIESCSQKMLDVMEKRATVENNLDAIRLCHKYKIFTVIGSLIGMPGETERTIQESIDNLSSVIPDDIGMPYELYRNFVQAVPGTPLYEYARRIGLVGKSLKDEERYIESLCEVNAEEIQHYLNFTDYQKEEVAYWGYYIYLELVAAYIKRHGYVNVLKHHKSKKFRAGLIYILFPKKIRRFLLKYLIIVKSFGIVRMLQVLVRKVLTERTVNFTDVNLSIRKINRTNPTFVREDEVNTAILRQGR
jgi:radical SAM superfamily enzyme YgiQ (UPF0313 family)